MIFLLLFLCGVVEAGTIKDFLGNPINNNAVTFLIRQSCVSNDVQHLNTLVNFEYTPKNVLDYAVNKCFETIGFRPISKEQIEVFVTSEKITASATDPPKQIELQYDGKQVMVCDRTEGTTTKGSDPGLTQFGAIGVGEKVLHMADDKIVQCQSVIITLAENVVLDQEWQLILSPTEIAKGKLEDSFQVAKPTPQVAFETLQAKTRCNPANLQKPDADAKKNHGDEFNKTVGLADSLKDGSGKPFTVSDWDTSGGCAVANQFGLLATWTDDTGNPHEEEEISAVKCVLNPADNTWQYQVSQSGAPTPIFVQKNTVVKAACTQYKCRTCQKLDELKESCQSDVKCTRADPIVPGGYTKCYSLPISKCTNKFVYLNDAYEVLEDTADVECKDGKYIVNKKEVKSIRCASSFSAIASKPKVDEPKTIRVPTESVEPVNCHNKTVGCECVNTKGLDYLAIVNKAKDAYLRVNHLKFDDQKNKWFYNRTINEKEARISEFNSVARCIGKVTRLEDLPNPGKNIVVAANVAVLVICLVVVTPAVILFVNARVKKREALKAAKKDKKKDEKSEEKKEEMKKEEEKKNEA